MIATIRRLLRREEGGIGMIMVVGFMGLCVPILTSALALAGTLSNDSQVKNNLAKNQYSSIGAIEYVRYLSEDPERWDDWLDENPTGEDLDIGDDEINILADQDGFSDQGFLQYCIFGSNQVHVKENSFIDDCSIGSNGNIEIKENSTVDGDIVSGGNVTLKENVVVNGDVTAAGTVTLNGATVTGVVTPGAVVEAIAGPTPNFDVTVTITHENNETDVENMSVEGDELPGTFDLTGGGSNVTVNSNQTYNLAPGSYGNVEVKENATLNLSSGNYAFLEIIIKENCTINLDVIGGPIVFDAVDNLEFKENITMNLTGGTAADFVVRVSNQAQFKENGDYVGTYFGFASDYAEMHVKENSTLTGALYGDVVEVKENTVVTGLPASAVYLSFFE